MQVRTIKNPDRAIAWSLKPSQWPLKSEASCRSKVQYATGQLLLERFPLDPILEDVTIPESRLSLDFFLPQRKLAVEVQGSQHSELNPFFHKKRTDFHRQIGRDEDKRFFCDLNDIVLVTISNPDELLEILNASDKI